MRIILTFLFFIYLLSTHRASAQTTKDYFSKPGLNINAFSVDVFGDTASTSYSYSHKTLVCGDTAVVFTHNINTRPVFLVFEGQKVYRTNYSCVRELIYDFGMEVGDHFFEDGCYLCEVVAKHDTLLLNGEMRLFMDLEINGNHVYWIEGIGNVRTGIHNDSEYENSTFICARDSTGYLWINDVHADKCEAYSCRRPRAQFLFETDDLSVNFVNDSKFANQYEWDFGDGMNSASYHDTHTFINPGCYTTKLTVRNDCYPDSTVITEAVPVCIGFNWDTLATIDFVENFTLKTISDSLHFLINTYPYGYLFRSTDGARTWQEINLPPVSDGFRAIADLEMFDENRGIIATWNTSLEQPQAVLITNDGGKTWIESGLEGANLGFVTLGKNGVAYASGSSQEVFKTEDYGQTWTDLTNVIRRIQALWNFGDSVLIAQLNIPLPSPNYINAIVKSYDDGVSWDTVHLPAYIRHYYFITPQLGFGADINATGIFKTVDGGLNWTLHWPDLRLFGITAYDQQHAWLADYNGILYYTDDAFESMQIVKCGPKFLFGLTPGSASDIIVSDGRHLMSYKGSVGFPCLDPDNDGDGYYGSADCDDTNFDINPAANEIANNSIDEDCDGEDLTTSIYQTESFPLTIYPNPTTGTLYIKSTDTKYFTLNLYDIQGALVKNAMDSSTIDASLLGSGMYYLEIINERNFRRIEKIVLIK